MAEFPESDSEQSFLEHLVELRGRLIRACLSILTVLVCLLDSWGSATASILPWFKAISTPPPTGNVSGPHSPFRLSMGMCPDPVLLCIVLVSSDLHCAELECLLKPAFEISNVLMALIHSYILTLSLE